MNDLQEKNAEEIVIVKRKSNFSFFVGIAIGMMIMAALTGAHGFYARQRFGEIDPTTKVREIYTILDRYSMFEFEIEDLLNSMYRGLISGLGDNNAQYLNARSFAEFNRRIGGVFVGIGVQIVIDPEDQKATVVTVFRGAPANEAGIMVGDKIVYVDGVSAVGLALQEIVNMIGGREHTRVDVTIFRPYEDVYIEKPIYRRRVEIPSVHHEVHEYRGEQIGYIQITTFDSVTYGQFNNALKSLTALGVSGIVIDLRNNSGGLLSSVTRITNMLIPEGIITYTKNTAGNRVNYYSNETYLGIPLVVLVNNVSASASEILSGAVRDSGAGTIIGERTFGKGTVQQTFELTDQSAIVITVRKFYTPSGELIEGVGITPQIYVEMYDELSRRVGSLSIEEDVQLAAALQAIIDKLD